MAVFLIIVGAIASGWAFSLAWEKRRRDGDYRAQAPAVLVGMIAGPLLLVAGISVVATSPRNTDKPPPEPTWIATYAPGATQIAISPSPEAPTSTSNAAQEEHGTRETARSYWTVVIDRLAFAGAAISLAGNSEQSGDDVAAQQYLTQAEKQADLAYDSAGNGTIPDGDAWTDIQGGLLEAADDYRKAIQSFKDGLGSGNSEQVATALDGATQAGQILIQETHEARVWYAQHGGKGSDLADYPTEERGAEAIVKALIQSQ